MNEAVLLGCDFSSRPQKRKPIVMAWGRARAGVVQLSHLHKCETQEAFLETLRAPAD